MSEIKINNDYFFETITDIKECEDNLSDIKNISYRKIKKKKKIVLLIDFKTIEEKEYPKLLRKVITLKKLLKLNKIEVGVIKKSKKLIGYLMNYDGERNQKNFISGINAALYNNRKERYNYIYDTVCEYLDNEFYGKNICDFKNNQCGEKRGTSSKVGCCRHYKHKVFSFSNKLVTCEHLTKDYKCGAKCLSCKLFTCDYLEKRGYKFRINDILLLKVFFNPIQKIIIKTSLFKTKESIMKLLLLT